MTFLTRCPSKGFILAGWCQSIFVILTLFNFPHLLVLLTSICCFLFPCNTSALIVWLSFYSNLIQKRQNFSNTSSQSLCYNQNEFRHLSLSRPKRFTNFFTARHVNRAAGFCVTICWQECDFLRREIRKYFLLNNVLIIFTGWFPDEIRPALWAIFVACSFEVSTI